MLSIPPRSWMFLILLWVPATADQESEPRRAHQAALEQLNKIKQLGDECERLAGELQQRQAAVQAEQLRIQEQLTQLNPKELSRILAWNNSQQAGFGALLQARQAQLAASQQYKYIQTLNAYRSLAEGDQAHVSGYWIGVHCEPVSETTLDVQDFSPVIVKGGLRVRSVVPNAPAAKAGVAEGDIIIAIDGHLVTVIDDLLVAVGHAQDQVLELAVVRDNAGRKIHVQPEKRPEDNKVELEGSKLTLSWRQVQVPEEIEVRVKKERNKPVRVTISRGDDSWTITENELNQLPEELRGYARQFFQLNDPQSGVQNLYGTAYWLPSLSGAGVAAAEKGADRLAAIEAKLDELRRAVAELKQQAVPQDPAPQED